MCPDPAFVFWLQGCQIWLFIVLRVRLCLSDCWHLSKLAEFDFVGFGNILFLVFRVRLLVCELTAGIGEIVLIGRDWICLVWEFEDLKGFVSWICLVLRVRLIVCGWHVSLFCAKTESWERIANAVANSSQENWKNCFSEKI